RRPGHRRGQRRGRRRPAHRFPPRRPAPPGRRRRLDPQPDTQTGTLMNRRTLMAAVAACALQLAAGAPAAAQHLPAITTPKQAFGHDIGEDYFLANFTQTEAYFKTLAGQSDRTKL